MAPLSGTIGSFYALLSHVDLVCGSAKEVIVMLDPRTAANDRLRDTERWGYTGGDPDDAMLIEESGDRGHHRRRARPPPGLTRVDRPMTESELPRPLPGTRTAIGADPIGVDPIGNDPLDFSDAPPVKGEGPNRTIGGWLTTATGFFVMVIVLAIVMAAIILMYRP